MKKLITVVILCLLLPCTKVKSQWITSINVYPAFPSTVDTIFVYASCEFPSGSCDQHIQGLSTSANTIYAYATHCLGMLTFICDWVDTFRINPLPPGTYQFDFQLNAGALPFPCTPGINPGPADSISFIVSPDNSVHSPISISEAEQFLKVFQTHYFDLKTEGSTFHYRVVKD